MERLTRYEMDLQAAADAGYLVAEDITFDSSASGLICGNVIAIRPGLTEAEKRCVLAEELSHGEISSGNILDLSQDKNRREEARARRRTFRRLIDMKEVVRLWLAGYQDPEELAEKLGVTPDFLAEGIRSLYDQHGRLIIVDSRLVLLDPFKVITESD